MESELFNAAGTGMVFVCPVLPIEPSHDDFSSYIAFTEVWGSGVIVPDRLHFLPVVALEGAELGRLQESTIDRLRGVIRSIFD